jgi:hypothetical protein
MSSNQAMTDDRDCPFGVGGMGLIQISHLLKELSIPRIAHLSCDSESLTVSIKNSISLGTAVSHIATKYYLAADMARDEKINLSYTPTAEILIDCFTKPLQKPAFFKQCALMGMIGLGLGYGLSTLENDLGIGTGYGIRNGLGNNQGNGIATGKATGIAIGKLIDWARLF